MTGIEVVSVGGFQLVAVSSLSPAQRRALALIARLRLVRSRGCYALIGDHTVKVSLKMADKLIAAGLVDVRHERAGATLVCTPLGFDTFKRMQQNGVA